MARMAPVSHDERLSIVEHLDELRSRLITCAIGLALCFALCYSQSDRILDWINAPLETTQNLQACQPGTSDPLEQQACGSIRAGEAFRALERAAASLADVELPASAREEVRALTRAAKAAADATPTNRERQPVTLGVTEPFLTTISVALYSALLLAMPLLLYQAYAFVLPAFTPQERRTALPLMLMVPVLFLGGVAFAYFVALPRALDFLQNFNDDSFDILLSARDFYKFSIVFLGGVGLLFQIPVGVLAVTRLGVVSAKTLQANRGYVLLALAVLAAVLTPTPDPVTMIIAMAPLVVLFELSVTLARFFEKREEKRRAEGGETGGWWDEDGDDGDGDDGDEPGDDPSSPGASGLHPVDPLERALDDEPAVP